MVGGLTTALLEVQIYQPRDRNPGKWDEKERKKEERKRRFSGSIGILYFSCSMGDVCMGVG